jgi:putative phage-type endonuclease
MVKTIVSTKGMNKDEWMRYRNKGIGGSDAAVVCGISRYKSPIELWMEKTGMIQPKEAGESAYWGTVMEPLIRQEFSMQTGFEVGIESSMLKHSQYEFMLANIDGVVLHPEYGGCLFEAKNSKMPIRAP